MKDQSRLRLICPRCRKRCIPILQKARLGFRGTMSCSCCGEIYSVSRYASLLVLCVPMVVFGAEYIQFRFGMNWGRVARMMSVFAGVALFALLYVFAVPLKSRKLL